MEAKKITINEKRCKRCRICVEFCPQEVLQAKGTDSICVVNLEKCTVCRFCEKRCPDFAICVEE